jgi:hypothetical protein
MSGWRKRQIADSVYAAEEPVMKVLNNEDDIIMTIRKKKIGRRIIIDLTGPEGNAFSLLAYANRYARALNLDGEVITEEMQAGDYENLVMTFDKYFGEYVTLER